MAEPPTTESPSQQRTIYFEGPGDVRAQCRVLDWRSTALGDPGHWPLPLRIIAQVVLSSGFPKVVLWGPELVQLYNDAYAEIIGGKHPSALGRGNRETWPELWDRNGPIYERVFAGETVTLQNALYPLRRAGEEESVYLTISYTPICDEEARVCGVLASMLDMTREVTFRQLHEERERLAREAELARERLRRIVDEIPVGLCVVRGPEHRFELVNRAYERSARRPVPVGSSVQEVFGAEASHRAREHLDQVYRSREGSHQPEVRVALRSSESGLVEERVFRTSWVPLFDGEDPALVSGVLNLSIDITDEVRQRDHIEALRAEAEEANRGKSEFLAVMSHELRTPLNAIGGYAELMEMGLRGPVTSQQREDLGRIQKSQRHLLGLINAVLNYTRLETGAVAFEIEDVPIDQVIGAAEVLVGPQLRAKGLRYQSNGCGSEVLVRADGEKLQQVLLNLLVNAVKFTQWRDGLPGEISVRCEADEEQVYLRVRDNGAGIPPEKRVAIFDPFVQVNSSLTRTTDGVGLGLAISRDLARGMGGDLVLEESAVGEGSTFLLSVPRAR